MERLFNRQIPDYYQRINGLEYYIMPLLIY